MANKDLTPVAKDIITTCTKCKLELRHVVVAQDRAGVVTKVRCYTCGTEHKYHPEKRHAETRKKTASIEKYTNLMEQHKDKDPRPYGMNEKYDIHDVIEHKVFGKGIVTKSNDQKIDVLFETGQRILACGR
ncbi:conserved hypothetical protein [uncultured Desulfobacterium sp.]|uniref:Uncharacterized protein n=1 Tax=uncultured Desulfobacterium sp. TaxID=201089 RepID=A0A445MU95_9BACT|nr:conserved hypothetical protein [uncultured Desulfobacterium sp.]